MTNALRFQGEKQAKVAGDGTFKALILDIETVPHTAKVWGLWNETIPLARLLEAGEVICFAAKWLDDPHSKTMFFSNHHASMSSARFLFFALRSSTDAISRR